MNEELISSAVRTHQMHVMAIHSGSSKTCSPYTLKYNHSMAGMPYPNIPDSRAQVNLTVYDHPTKELIYKYCQDRDGGMTKCKFALNHEISSIC